MDAPGSIADIVRRLADLERRVEALEGVGGETDGRGSRDTTDGDGASVTTLRPRLELAPSEADDRGSSGASAPAAESTRYHVAQLEPPASWIELHEPSARRDLHRCIIEVLEIEGPAVDAIVVKRVREAWGIKRAGARIQQVFDQAFKALIFNERIVRIGTDALALPDQPIDVVRRPGADPATHRAADEIPACELDAALVEVAGSVGPGASDDVLTQGVARTFGWTRRGTGIQRTLDERIDALRRCGALA